MIHSRTKFATFAWILLGYNVLVILWGAFVRATGSGAGCGSHWPLCNGEIVPKSPALETIIEFSHRLSSGLLGILVIVLVIWSIKQFDKGNAVRKSALWTLVFVITEAAIGAGLVKFEWVAADTSLARVYTMAFHLLNTFFLLGANTLCAWFATTGKTFRLRNSGAVGLAIACALGSMLLLGASGAVTALGDTLYLTLGITPEESPLVSSLIGLRVYHPLLAFVTFGFFVLAFRVISTHQPHSPAVRFGGWTIVLFLVQLLCGGLNVYLMAPAWMQLVHLLLTDLIWILTIVTAAAAFVAIQTGNRSWMAPVSHRHKSVA